MRIGAALQATRLDLVLLIDLPSDETPSSMCASKLQSLGGERAGH